MDKKLRILMQNEKLTASKLAEVLEIKPAAISHILSGRNKPGYELICKIVTRFPHINPYWLLGDAQDMLNTNVQNTTSDNHESLSGTLFDFDNQKSETTEQINTVTPEAVPIFYSSEIEKIVIIYRDKTFEELRPKKS